MRRALSEEPLDRSEAATSSPDVVALINLAEIAASTGPLPRRREHW